MKQVIEKGIAIATSLILFLSGMLPGLPTAPAFAQGKFSVNFSFELPKEIIRFSGDTEQTLPQETSPPSTSGDTMEGAVDASEPVPLPLPLPLPRENDDRPNILVIMGDDVGWFNISAYNDGMMGYKTPNIDRIANEGIRFTDAYAENSCTAGRSAFIMGQSPGRTGMTKVGLPGVDFGPSDKDITLAEILKEEGYATGQFGKNHLGDLDKFLPTNHGFEEFFGNLYHLNAEEEPENPDYPDNDLFAEKFGPKGVLWAYDTRNQELGNTLEQQWADSGICESVKDSDADSVTPQKICNTGMLDIARMPTVDEEFRDAAIDFMERSVAAGKPFLTWYNTSRMHVFTHLKPESQGVTGQGIYADGMVEHDAMVGELLDKLEELGVAENTIVIYTTDNGAEVFSWPDGGTTPFYSEKNTNWEGGFRVPMMVRWPARWEGGAVSNDIISMLDWLPTLTAATGIEGIADIKDTLLSPCLKKQELGYKIACDPAEEVVYEANGKDFGPIHLDGYNFLPYLDYITGAPVPQDVAFEAPRHEFFYLTDDAYPSALRFDDWKIIFAEQRAEGFEVWSEPFVKLRTPMILNLRRDPFEVAPHESENYPDWRFRRTFMLAPAQMIVAEFLDTFRDYPPRQFPASFSIEGILDDLLEDLQMMGLD